MVNLYPPSPGTPSLTRPSPLKMMGSPERQRPGDSKTVNAPNAPPQLTLPGPFEVEGKLGNSPAKLGVTIITDVTGDGLSRG